MKSTESSPLRQARIPLWFPARHLFRVHMHQHFFNWIPDTVRWASTLEDVYPR